MRIRLDVAYDGTDFHGWAAQPGLRTVEGELSAALTTVLRLPADQPARLTCAGRTDAGVHARGQVVHLDIADEVEPPVGTADHRAAGSADGAARGRVGGGTDGSRRAPVGAAGDLGVDIRHPTAVDTAGAFAADTVGSTAGSTAGDVSGDVSGDAAEQTAAGLAGDPVRDRMRARSAGRARPGVPQGPDEVVRRLARRVNGVLAPDLRVRAATPAPAGFDARFSPLWRRYAYRVADLAASVDPLRRREVLNWPRPLDVAAMATASEPLTGLHDFAAFCKRRDGATTVRTLLELTWTRDAAGVVVATVRADAFCHSMVRALVGCLLAVGEGRRPPSWPVEVLTGGRRDPAAAVVAAHGLTLEQVGFPPDAELAARAERTRARRGAPG